MAPPNSTSVSVKIDEDWVKEKQQIFSGKVIVNIYDDEYPCVFRVPTTLAQTKPQAYAPQEVGLGPLHHHRLDLYTMQRRKLIAAVKFLQDHAADNFQKDIIPYMQLQEYRIRAIYHENLDIPSQALAWIIAIDAVYLLHFLLKFHRQKDNADDDEDGGGGGADGPPIAKLAADILMLENQIPISFLTHIFRNTNLETSPSLRELIFNFYKKLSPLKMDKKVKIVAALVVKNQGHLLSILYHSILEAQDIKFDESSSHHDQPSEEVSSGDQEGNKLEDPISIISGQGKDGPSLAAKKGASDDEPTPSIGLFERIQEAVQVFNMVWGTMTGMFKNMDPDYEANPGVEEIRIPSVLQLKKHAGIEIEPLPGVGGINSVKFVEEEKKLLLPRLTLDSNSEVVFRNLCAYEEARYKAGVMCEFFDLLCGIVDHVEDVKILQDSLVISEKSDLEDKEIVGMFSRKSKSTLDKEKKKSNIGDAIENINRVYGQSRKVRILRFIWKVVDKFRMLMIILLILGVIGSLLLSAACQFMDCQKLR